MRKLLWILAAALLATACGPADIDDPEATTPDEDWAEELATEDAALTGSFDSTAESTDFSRINQRRAAIGKNKLARRACLNTVARQWARQMASSNVLSHNPRLREKIDYYCKPYGLTLSAYGENVGVGASELQVWNAFMNSPDHKANIQSSTFGSGGVGIYNRADGRVWVTQVFARF